MAKLKLTRIVRENIVKLMQKYVSHSFEIEQNVYDYILFLFHIDCFKLKIK